MLEQEKKAEGLVPQNSERCPYKTIENIFFDRIPERKWIPSPPEHCLCWRRWSGSTSQCSQDFSSIDCVVPEQKCSPHLPGRRQTAEYALCNKFWLIWKMILILKLTNRICLWTTRKSSFDICCFVSSLQRSIVSETTFSPRQTSCQLLTNMLVIFST